jgi:hypothetical protein
MAPRRYAKLSATERESKNLVRAREFSIRHAQAEFGHEEDDEEGAAQPSEDLSARSKER